MKPEENKPDWAEYAVMFFFLAMAVIVLAMAGALLGDLIFRLWG